MCVSMNMLYTVTVIDVMVSFSDQAKSLTVLVNGEYK